MYIVNAEADLLLLSPSPHLLCMCENHIPNSCPRTLSSCRQSGPFSVQHEQAACMYPVMILRSLMCPTSDTLRAPVISQPVQRLGAPSPWSATPLSFTRWHWWPALGDGVVFCLFILFARRFALAVWLSKSHVRRRAQKKQNNRERHSFWNVKSTSTRISPLDPATKKANTNSAQLG